MRRMIDLHAWLGMASGLALFVAFFAGAINVFHHELHHWQEPHFAEQTTTPMGMDRLLERVTEQYPDARKRLYLLPDDDDPGVMWFESADSDWVTAHATDFNAEGVHEATPRSALADFINELHFALGIPNPGWPINIGMTFMGLISVMYGVALFSGLLIHWPKIRKEFFALKHEGNMHRFRIMDAANNLGQLIPRGVKLTLHDLTQ